MPRRYWWCFHQPPVTGALSATLGHIYAFVQQSGGVRTIRSRQCVLHFGIAYASCYILLYSIAPRPVVVDAKLKVGLGELDTYKTDRVLMHENRR
ncbi:hypothetical protein DENSPDRAFT_836490 [Dentipellis sp. KUC8613]|nr:hypothetical protein DENSPDRAFT_836490 [Dentipellis sp. KUC8613]